jgi:hypothetical protein
MPDTSEWNLCSARQRVCIRPQELTTPPQPLPVTDGENVIQEPRVEPRKRRRTDSRDLLHRGRPCALWASHETVSERDFLLFC